MNQARTQACCNVSNIIIGCFIGKEVYPRSFTERSKSLYFYKDQFRLIWKSDNVSFN